MLFPGPGQPLFSAPTNLRPASVSAVRQGTTAASAESSKPEPIHSDDYRYNGRGAMARDPRHEHSRAEMAQIKALEARDREVRQHEQAHLAAAGNLARGGIRYDEVRGPDGRRYAIAGEVQIDVSPVPGDPRATIEKAQRVQRAALAPSEPSGKDRQIARQAQSMELDARVELAAASVDVGGGEEVPGTADEVKGTATVSSGPGDEAKSGTCAQCGGNHAVAVHTESNLRQLSSTYVADMNLPAHERGIVVDRMV